MSKQPGLNEMRRVLTAEADRLYGTEMARKKLGEKPNSSQLRKVEVLDAAGDLLARIIPVVGDVSKAIRGVSIKPMRRDGIR
ncbi:hypothetical protein [Mesorhizobium sp. Z1-4]|uniref:hypothetical protein n=1 Tax=Mesorhizobium sp. Z1-4 TaxID=2448478 RepID=UPI000FD92AA3|nr:hypothetical protein [Mesorhizobium sp. Z1-4]